MKAFMNDDFLLTNEVAKRLYHDHAATMPIYDYHCHLSPREILEDRHYDNITQLWLGGDHYKWRAMRSHGVAEKYITGDASDWDKFYQWAVTIEHCYGNPLFHWTHLELRRYFHIEAILSTTTAKEIWEEANRQIQEPTFSVRTLLQRSHVQALCTTDDPLDSLDHHIALAQDEHFSIRVMPTFRADPAWRIGATGFTDWLRRLESLTSSSIGDIDAYTQALQARVIFFHASGCRIADHALEAMIYRSCTKEVANDIFLKRLQGEKITDEEEGYFLSYLLIFLGKIYAELGWVMQLHIGAMRNNNLRQLEKLGVDSGFDSISDQPYITALAQFFSVLDYTNELPKTIVYNLNPRDNEALSTLLGAFHGEGIRSKMQFGSGWWFLDQKDGMQKQMVALANLGLLANFVGMVTDSRSFLSYVRHEYFRRILCNMVGEWVISGEIPYDMPRLSAMVEDICFNNIQEYLPFGE